MSLLIASMYALSAESLSNYNFFLCTNVFFAAAALFYVYKIQNRKPHRKVTKLKSKFYLFLG